MPVDSSYVVPGTAVRLYLGNRDSLVAHVEAESSAPLQLKPLDGDEDELVARADDAAVGEGPGGDGLEVGDGAREDAGANKHAEFEMLKRESAMAVGLTVV